MKTPIQLKAEYLQARATELDQDEYPELPWSKFAEVATAPDVPVSIEEYWRWVASHVTSFTAITHCLVDRDPVRHSIRFIEALNVEDAGAVAIEDEIAERKHYPIQRDGGYKPEHFSVVAIFRGHVRYDYFKFN